jgi:hypothetical protein
MAENPFHIEKRYYAQVDAYSVSVDEYVMPEGDTLALEELGGNAFGSIDSQVRVAWDLGGDQEEVMLVTHGDTVQKTGKVFVGDGVKKLTIELSNNTGVAQSMGGYYLGLES